MVNQPAAAGEEVDMTVSEMDTVALAGSSLYISKLQVVWCGSGSFEIQ